MYLCLLTAVGPTPTWWRRMLSVVKSVVVCLLDAVARLALAQLVLHPLSLHCQEFGTGVDLKRTFLSLRLSSTQHRIVKQNIILF